VSDYAAVKGQLQQGIDPTLLCAACPWDRLCVTPPAMTTDEVSAKMSEVESPSPSASRSEGEQALAKLLFTAVAYGGRDTQATLCPVLAAEMRSPQGRELNEVLRAKMGGPR